MTQYLVIPAKAGIQTASVPVSIAAWSPAFAGVTGRIWS
jgi:hypothetical protein